MGDNSGGLGKLKFITGDIDVVAILTADGRMAPAYMRAMLYDDFLHTIGMQHGESLSWVFKGEFFSSKQAKLLADHVPTQELLAVFGPDGLARAAYFDPLLTAVDVLTGDTVATFVGAYSTPLQKIKRYTSIRLGNIRRGPCCQRRVGAGNPEAVDFEGVVVDNSCIARVIYHGPRTSFATS